MNNWNDRQFDMPDQELKPEVEVAHGYHLRKITTQGVFGETSKIREELEELEEALEQDNKILALCELSDLFGAIEGVAEKLGVKMDDVMKMSAATKRAFLSGQRVAKHG